MRTMLKITILSCRLAEDSKSRRLAKEAANCRDGRGDLQDTLIFALTPEDHVRARAEWEQAQ